MVSLPSSSTLLSTYTSLTASILLLKSLTNQLLPPQLQSYLSTSLHNLLFSKTHPQNLTLIIQELDGYLKNQLYTASETYLRTLVTPHVNRLLVTQAPRETTLTFKISTDQELNDTFQDVHLKWKLVSSQPTKGGGGSSNGREDDHENYYKSEKRCFELSFEKRYKDLIMGCYLPYVMKRSKELREVNKVLKLYSLGLGSYCADDVGNGVWGSINLEHPATFATLAMDPKAKELLVEDLERFVRRREFYKRVGKAWKRGYLLYGPPGTGKSSLIAAMANYLKFDVYDLELANLRGNSDLRSLLISTTNRSILVIEDIDCSTMELKDRDEYETRYNGSDTKLTLSGLLNFIDGLWSSCGDERIIVFTTNHKDRLDPALLRPGRMDMHINMSYCTVEGFKLLASNYLAVDDRNWHLEEIEELIREAEITPAEVAEELMKDEDADAALGGLVKFLKRKKMESSSGDEEAAKRLKPEKEGEPEAEAKPKLIPRRNNMRMGRLRGGYRRRGTRQAYRV